MSRKMLINATHPEEHRVAIVEDGTLVELDIEITGKEQTRGNIYKGVVVRVETGLQAAFVDFGSERPGFLQIGEIHPSFFKNAQNGENKGRPRINDLLHRGQELLVQVVKEERGTKGAALTTYLSLPGRFMVLMPDSDTKGVSRKIEQESQRKKLKETMASLNLPDNIGYIVRTAGVGQKKTDLKRDVDYLIRVYEKILDLAKKIKSPTLIYKESNLVIRSIRDYFSSDIDEVLVDDPGVAKEAKEFFEIVMPEYARLVKLHQERRPIFARYQIEDQIESIGRNKVSLPSGGSIVIDSTEALVAVDVNSGKLATEQGVEATAFKSNMEAAQEVARQLRLRDLGGLIVIDFIDMRDRKHTREVEKCLKDALKTDKARVTVGRISQFGLLEMSRQRIKSVLAAASFLPCPHCEGTGKVKNIESQALDFLRRVYTGMAKGHIGQVEAEIPLEVASYLLNQKRAELVELERYHGAVIMIKGRPDFISGQMEVNFIKREKDNQVTTQQYIDAASARSDVPAQPEKETEEREQQTEKPDSAAAREEGGRKRRRPRRRRKSSAEEPEKVAASAQETPPRPAAVGTAPQAAENLLDQLMSGRSGTPSMETRPTAASGDRTTEKPAQAAVGGKQAADREAGDKPAEGAVKQADSDNSRTRAEEAPSTGQQEAEKPQRKPRRRRKPAAASQQTSAPQPAEEKAGDSSGGEERSQGATSQPAEPISDPEAKGEQGKTPRKPRRRSNTPTRKTEDKEKAAASQAEAAPEEPAKSPSQPGGAPQPAADAAPEKKPARPRRPRKTTRSTAAKSEAAETPSGETPPAEGDKEKKAEKKPARRGRPRKTAAAKAEEVKSENTKEKTTES